MPIKTSGPLALIADIEAEFPQGANNVSLAQAGVDAGLNAGDLGMFEFYGLSNITEYATHWLVAAGGGSGGYGYSGAGGYRTSFGTSGGGAGAESQITLTIGNTYTITVGAANNNSSLSGSGISTITSIAGGVSGTPSGISGTGNGATGGSGGGAYKDSDNRREGASGGAGTAGQGYNGGGLYGRRLHIPGGGGAGGPGASTSGTNASGAGGAGVTSSITGGNVPYARGQGNNITTVPNKGDGGQNGVVILRVPTSLEGTASGASRTTTGSDTVFTWTSNGSYTA